jgi:hypothetical protein
MGYERLTERDDFGIAYRGNMRDCLDRLASYEDSGLSPEQVQELAKAKEEGRLVVLPCKVGDTVFVLASKRISEFCADPLHKEIIECKVIEFVLKENGISVVQLYSTDDRIADYRYDTFCKTVFFTRKEAEKALGGNYNEKD